MTIYGYVVGDELEIKRHITVTQAITKAWLTIGADVVNKAVTTSDVPGTGQIEDDGGTSGIAVVRFDLTKANTTTLSTTRHRYDIQIKFANGNINTPEVSYMQFIAGLTDETS